MEELLDKIKNIVYECGNIILNAKQDGLDIKYDKQSSIIITNNLENYNRIKDAIK